MLLRNDGMVKGDKRRGPLLSVVRTASAMAGKPPTPEAMMVAVRSCSSGVLGAQLACFRASSAAARANRIKRSILRCSLAANSRSGSKPASGSCNTLCTWPPMVTARSPINSCGNRRMPDCPSSKRCQVDSTLDPSGVSAPMPVTTIRLLMLNRLLLLEGYTAYGRHYHHESNMASYKFVLAHRNTYAAQIPHQCRMPHRP